MGSNIGSATVSAKIPEELRQKLKEYGVKISGVVRRALEEEVRAREEADIGRLLDEISSKLGSRISKKDVVEAIRSWREEH